MTHGNSPHVWKFFRTGGIDQVLLRSADDLRALEQLDQKLWMALSCPVRGIELDEKTLALIDSDGDGRIRVPEVLAAVKWASDRLRDPGVLLQGMDALPVDAVNTESAEGKVLLASARRVLSSIGRPDAGQITVGEAADTAGIFSANPLNGSGVIPPEATDDPEVQALIKDIIACMGGSPRRDGPTGITAANIEAFFAEVGAYTAWVDQSAGKEIAILDDATALACAALQAVRAKVEDYFARIRLASFDDRSLASLNGDVGEYPVIAAKVLTNSAEELAAFPIARVEPGRALPLLEGVNPAWAEALSTLHARVVSPLLGPGKAELTEKEWGDLNARFAPYETWLGGKKGGAVEKLGLGRMKEIQSGNGRETLAALVARDRELEPEFKALTDVERLVRYHRDLSALLHNFVNFADFYSPDRLAVFQAGTLYLDSRSSELCIRVAGPSPLAAMSKAYIAYCNCTRSGEVPMTVAACITQGDSDYLFVGRHGVFYDRKGRDWDATITAIADNPISVRQAFWAPYKKFVRMIEEQVAKRAAAAEAQSSGRLATAAEKVATADKAGATGAQKKVDVGTVAALGVAVGAIGGALGAIATGLAGLAVWQIPLVVVALILVISLPSMAIASLKLRQRTLGPILESSGWAVNARIRINIPFGTALTDVAQLPPGSTRSLEDPYADAQGSARRLGVLLAILVILLVVAAGWIRLDAVQHPDTSGVPQYFWQRP